MFYWSAVCVYVLRLHIIVEFQLPRKNPMPIFLYARESDTIDILQTQVQYDISTVIVCDSV